MTTFSFRDGAAALLAATALTFGAASAAAAQSVRTGAVAAQRIVARSAAVDSIRSRGYRAWFEATKRRALRSGAPIDTALRYSDLTVVEAPRGALRWPVRAFTARSGPRSIWVVLSPKVERDRLLVEHEFLHALLAVRGHPQAFARLGLTRFDVP